MPYIDQFLLPMVAYYILLKLSIFASLKFQKIKTEASGVIKFVSQKVYLFKHVLQLLPSIWSVLLECLHHFYVVIFYGVFFWDVCFCFCLWFCSVFSVAFILFSFVFIFGQNFSSNSKGTDVTTAVVELNIRTIIALLLLTLEIVHYLRKLTVQ